MPARFALLLSALLVIASAPAEALAWATKIAARVAPSGQGIYLEATDDAGVKLNITSMSTGDEVQSLAISGNPAGGAFTLTLAGETTAPIAAIPSAPATYFRWNRTLDAPGQVDLAVNICYDSLGSATATYEVMDGGSVIGTVTRTLQSATGNPTTFKAESTNPDGARVDWTTLGRFTFSTTSVSVRLSAPAPASNDPEPNPSYRKNRITADCLRVAPVGGTAVVVGSAVPPAQQASEGAAWYRESRPNRVANSGTLPAIGRGLGAGIRYLLSPTEVKAKIEALASVGAGNITATGNGDPRSPVQVSFVAGKGNTAIPLMVSGDSAVTPARVFAGGILPTFKKNGTAIATGLPGLRVPFWGEGKTRSNGGARTSGAYLPPSYFALIQGLKAPIYESANTNQNTTSGTWARTRDQGGAIGALVGYAKLPWTATGTTPSVTWRQAPLKTGTYRVSVTWPTTSGLSTAVTYTITNRAGTTLGTLTVNQSAAPSGFSDKGVTWQDIGEVTLSGSLTDDLYVKQTNGTSARMVADSIRIERTSADDSVTIEAGDTITYSAGAGWCASSAGAAPAASDAAVSNLVGTPLYPTLPTAKKMYDGWNINEFRYYSGVVMYFNFAKGLEQIAALEYDADGYPTKTATQTVSGQTALLSQDSFEADGMRWPSIPPGNYVLMWDGPEDFTMTGTPNGDPVITGTKDNKRFYRLDRDALGWGAPSLRVDYKASSQNTDGTWKGLGKNNLRIFQLLPGVDVASPPRWRPEHVARITGVKNLRFIDPLGSIDGNATTWADFQGRESALTRSYQARVRLLDIARFEAYTGPEIWNKLNGQVWKITTAGPHGFSDGTRIDFDQDSTVGSVTYSNGQVQPIKGMYGPTRVLSPTELLFQFGKAIEDTGGVLNTSSTVLTAPVGKVRAKFGNSMLFSDLVDMCNVAGADFHLNVPVTATDDAVTQMGRYLAANLRPGLKVRVAYGNEYWNFTHKVFDWVFRQSYGTTNPNDGRRIGTRYDPVPYLCEQSRRIWSLVGAELTAAGRGSDLIRVLEGQFANPGGTTQPIASYCKNRRAGGGVVEQAGDLPEPIDFDEFGVAPYFQNHVGFTAELASEAWYIAIADILTPDQLLDFYEMYSVYGRWGDDIKAHRTILDANGFKATKIITYEGGPERMIPPTGIPNRIPARLGQRTHAVHRHPRYWGVTMHTNRVYQDAGVSLFNYFLLGLADQTPRFEMWSAFTGTAQAAYKPGDATQDAIQINQFDRTDLIKSVTGGAVLAWAALPGPGDDTPIEPLPDVTPWVRVSAQKPTPGVKVLVVVTPGGTDYSIATYDGTAFTKDGGGAVNPVLWAPLYLVPASL